MMFHRVSDEYDPLWPPLPVKTFRYLMKELHKNAYVVPLEKIGEIGKYPEKPLVAISFDDGYWDFLENAVPILSEYNLPAHHNICPGLIDKGVPPWTQILGGFILNNLNKQIQLPHGKFFRVRRDFDEKTLLRLSRELCSISDEIRFAWISSLEEQVPKSILPRLMSWDRIRECARAGIHIGSHGMNHRNMSKIEGIEILAEEINDSKRRIGEEVGAKPLIFAFPNGLYTPLGTELVRESGYKVALLSSDMVLTYPDDIKGDFDVFPRINMSKSSWKEENLRLLGLHRKLKRFLNIKFLGGICGALDNIAAL